MSEEEMTLKFNWQKAYLDMESTKSIFPSGTSLKTNYDAFEWLAEEIEKKYSDPLSRDNNIIIKKFQRINLYLEE